MACFLGESNTYLPSEVELGGRRQGKRELGARERATHCEFTGAPGLWAWASVSSCQPNQNSAAFVRASITAARL